MINSDAVKPIGALFMMHIGRISTRGTATPARSARSLGRRRIDSNYSHDRGFFSGIKGLGQIESIRAKSKRNIHEIASLSFSFAFEGRFSMRRAINGMRSRPSLSLSLSPSLFLSSSFSVAKRFKNHSGIRGEIDRPIDWSTTKKKRDLTDEVADRINVNEAIEFRV